MLVLGGTGEGREVAARLADSSDLDVVTSLAGRVRDPRWPEGEVRVGGFGGAEGLAEWLHENSIQAVLDATHPFAARITANAHQAAAACSIPFAICRRPPWPQRDGDTWLPARDLDHAAELVPTLGRRPFLTIGRQGVSAFAGVHGVDFLIRSIDPPSGEMPESSTLILARGPFDVESEVALMRRHDIDVVVTKSSGGDQTYAKIVAARALKLPVVMVSRPLAPTGAHTFDSPDTAAQWLESVRGSEHG
ncbi:cobalt-precorrin-6A reductase [Rhodococcus sp. SRB_17]|uniref:cobalt-precorrin-6A reductase n=1 Tax=Rhodococcus sp. OK302 TaxID=1882769 RepID=UPI000B93D09D|nr:cobalt-precorrin-6A reductase [Rhodococcus sp. OK302]NMM85649.1 cobalt-precorrin-6A reductase [Rhodococcus sp. SRB_17]OYD70293.1 precorrin-6A/cobalt-precorrin-6A reductase [Rhodococcus sp. OK302]